jgi:hypothetical protein
MGDELKELGGYTGLRTLARLEGLTDDEFRWEPTPGAWTVRRLRSGKVVVDNNQYQRPPAPMTSIAWRVAHLIDIYGSPRNARWLRVDDPPSPPPSRLPWPIAWTADESLAMLKGTLDHFCELLAVVPEEAWWEKLGPIAGQYADATLAGFALHQIDEAIHHGAEASVLRDLYFWQHAEPQPEPSTVGEAATAGRWDLVEALTLDGGDVNGPAPTALHLSAAYGDLDMVKLLVEHGAVLDVTDTTYSATPGQWAEFFGRAEVAEYLRSQEA